MKNVEEAAKDRALHLNKLKKNIVKLVGTEQQNSHSYFDYKSMIWMPSNIMILLI